MVDKKMLIRWSIRDLRKRKLQVIAIAAIIGIGIGTYVGLSSTTEWRQNAFDQSSDMLGMYDLKIALSAGNWVNQSEIANIITTLPHNDWIDAIEHRVEFSTSVNVSTQDKVILSKGRIVGINMSDGSEGIKVNGIHVTNGRHIEPSENEKNVAIIENNFADYYDIAPQGSKAVIAGGTEFEILASGITPEYFMVLEGNILMAEASFCVLFIPLLTAQKIVEQQIGLPLGFINELLISVKPGVSLNEVKNEIENAIINKIPNTEFKVLTKDDEPGYSFMKDDIPGDQVMYSFISFIILLTAAFGTYILISRLVTSQRRQIGVNMALGVPVRQISYRYLILSLEIALLGIVIGFILSIVIGNAMAEVIASIAPLPLWKTWLVEELFIQGALIGIIIPIIASILPILNAIRVKPIQAIDPGYTLNVGSGASNLINKLPLPKSLVLQFPFRNITRNLKRTISSVTGIALAICILVTVFSFVDGSFALIDTEEEIINKNSPERFEITLNNVYNNSNYHVVNITSNDKFKETECAIQTPSKIYNSKRNIDILLRFQDINSTIWHPEPFKSLEYQYLDTPGIILSKKAANDLHVDVGGNLTIEHLFRKNSFTFFTKNTTFTVIGIYSSQIRFWAYANISDSHILNCSGLTNLIIANPKSGVSINDIQVDLFPIYGFNSIQSVSVIIDAYKEAINLLTSIFILLQYVVLVMALLITYNTTSIGIEERTRDIATMAAFGTPIWKITRMLIIENMIIGILGTLLGFFPFGYILSELFNIRVNEALPDVNIHPYISETNILTIIFIGVIVVALVPLITARKIAKMDLSASLRVIE